MEGRRRTGIIVGLVLIISISNLLLQRCNASIHDYRRESFSPQSNAFFFHGGSEGLYASKVHDSSNELSQDKPLKGKSFIRLFRFFCFAYKASIFVTNLINFYDHLIIFLLNQMIALLGVFFLFLFLVGLWENFCSMIDKLDSVTNLLLAQTLKSKWSKGNLILGFKIFL